MITIVVGVLAFVIGLVLGARHGPRWWFLLRGGRDDAPRGRLNGR